MNALALSTASDPRHAWLGVVLPRNARRFRTEDPTLATLLAEGGGEPVDTDPDVEIGEPHRMRGDAPYVVVPFYRWRDGGGNRGLRGLRRAARFTRLSVDLRRAARALRGLGYSGVSSIGWERSTPVVGLGLANAQRPQLAHRLPLNAVLVAHRGRPEPTIFEEVVAAARDVGHAQTPSRVVFGSSGVVVADVGNAVLRMAVGSARRRLQAHREVIMQLSAIEPPENVLRLVPTLIAHGSEGIADWMLEERLAGEHPARLSEDLARDCSTFLAGLARLPSQGSHRTRLEAAAETIAAACAAELGDEVLSVMSQAAAELDGRASCFVHGDFWNGNLLAAGDRLTGVIDWSAGGPDGMPLIDLLHLQVSSVRERTREPLGRAVANHLLAGQVPMDDSLWRAYRARFDPRLSPVEQRAVATAYWLDALARELRDPDSPHGPDETDWETENVRSVLGGLKSGVSLASAV